MRVAILINPISGTGGSPEIARRRAGLAAAIAARHGLSADIIITERPGHARELAASAVERGAGLVVAWGGDGTVNEIVSTVAFRDVALGVVPSGSGNGLARELGLPFDPAAALGVALTGRSRAVDCGELDGRLFVNVAGIGVDARVAHRFAALGLLRRGFLRYLEIGARELLRYEPDEHEIVADDVPLRTRPLVIALANARQYGNGALIAPDAEIDDGVLDLVVVAHRPVWRTLWHVRSLFNGRLRHVPGVTMIRVSGLSISATRQVLYHVDGEAFVGGMLLRARVHPRALRVRVAR